MISAQLAKVMMMLDEVSKRQDEYNNQYLSNSYNTRPTDSSVPASFSIVVFQNYFMNSLKLVWFLFVCMCKDFVSGG